MVSFQLQSREIDGGTGGKSDNTDPTVSDGVMVPEWLVIGFYFLPPPCNFSRPRSIPLTLLFNP